MLQPPAAFAGVLKLKLRVFEMSTTTHPKTAVCHQPDHTQSALAMIWTFHVSHPQWGRKLASLIDERLRQMLPEGCLKDVLIGQESEIRQCAALMLLQRFLNGNQQLQFATEQKDLAEVANQLQRSISASLRIASRRLRRSLQRDRSRFTEFNEIANTQKTIHPACREKVCELPFEAQRSLLLLLLEEGVRARSISPANSRMVQLMVDQELSQTEMAAELGITRQAVNQRIRCVAEGLEDSIEKAEFPLR